MHTRASSPPAPPPHPPPKSADERTGQQRPQQAPDAEDGDDEGPDEGHLPVLQGDGVPARARLVHQLHDELQLKMQLLTMNCCLISPFVDICEILFSVKTSPSGQK